MTRSISWLRRLGRSERGAAMIEFALTAPLFLLVLMGAFDYCWQMYAQQVLQGAVSKAGRDSTLEAYASNQSALDTIVREQVQQRSEEHTSELQSLMRISYAVFCLKKKKKTNKH